MEYMEQQMQQQIEAGLSNAEQCYARIAELEERNAALAAQVEALREAWEAVKRNDWDAPLDEAFEKTPQHHLRQVRADAGRVGYLQGHLDAGGSASDWNKKHSEYHANQYAASILAGKE